MPQRKPIRIEGERVCLWRWRAGTSASTLSSNVFLFGMIVFDLFDQNNALIKVIEETFKITGVPFFYCLFLKRNGDLAASGEIIIRQDSLVF
jgi:hypothetical protein